LNGKLPFKKTSQRNEKPNLVVSQVKSVKVFLIKKTEEEMLKMMS